MELGIDWTRRSMALYNHHLTAEWACGWRECAAVDFNWNCTLMLSVFSAFRAAGWAMSAVPCKHRIGDRSIWQWCSWCAHVQRIRIHFFSNNLLSAKMSQSVYAPFEEELKKNPELKVSDVEALRKWSEQQPHLPKIADSELALFLHSNYYRVEPTKSTIETFYSIRTNVPEFFSSRDPLGSKELRKQFKLA